MGTDIHGVFQKRNKNGTWEDVPHKYSENRHYSLFAWLGDVRNGTGFAGVPTHTRIEPLSSHRGFPHDFAVVGGSTADENAVHPIADINLLPEWRQKYLEDGEPLQVYMGYHGFSWLLDDEILNATPPRILRTGVISLDEFKDWDGVSPPPHGWSGAVWGKDLQTNHPSEINAQTTHVQVEWFADMAEEFEDFINEVRRLKELHGEVRFVFGFDS